jgi:hypothetical protein
MRHALVVMQKSGRKFAWLIYGGVKKERDVGTASRIISPGASLFATRKFRGSDI